MGNWWVHELWQDGRGIDLLSWIFWVLFSITLHELAHGWVALWEGDQTPRERDRLTLNPVVHMGGMSLLVFALCGIAWGQMPVNPHRFRHRRWGDLLVSAAGPAMNVLIGVVSLVLLVAWMKLAPRDSEWYRYGTVFLYYGVSLNLILAVLNMLPIPPLDGSHVLAGFSPRMRELYRHPNAPFVGLAIFGLIFFLSPLGGVLFGWAWRGADAAVDGAGSLVGNPPVNAVIYEDYWLELMLDPEFRRMMEDPEFQELLRDQGLEMPEMPAPPVDEAAPDSSYPPSPPADP